MSEVNNETPDIVYGRLLESAHLAGYGMQRACDEADWLLNDDRWMSVGPGYDDINAFLATVDFSGFDIGRKKRLADKLSQLQAKQTPQAKALGVTQGSISKWTGTRREEPDIPENNPTDEGTSEEAFDLQVSEPEQEPDIPENNPTDEAVEPQPEAEEVADSTEAESEQPKIKGAQVNEGDEWYTPRWLFDALGIKFQIDVCAPSERTYSSVPAERHFTIEDDGLAQPWEGTVWCNPPYSKPEPWARRMIHHGDGLLLTHIPMNAGWCVDAWETCDAIRLFQAMEFVRPDGTIQRPGYWLQLAAFGPIATEALGRLQPLGAAAFNKRRVASPMWTRAS